MNTAMTTSRGRMAPCFPGVELLILGPRRAVGQHLKVSTTGWQPLAWGQELMCLDVSVLLCAGIHRFLWGVLQGYGIQVIPNVLGDPRDILARWRSGSLPLPRNWPFYPDPFPGGGRRGRRRFRGGKGLA